MKNSVWFFLLISALLFGCAHDFTKTVIRHKPQIYEGTISAGAPFILFISNNNKDKMWADIPNKLSDYIFKQTEHSDPSSDSGVAQSIYVKFQGQITSTKREFEQDVINKMKVIKVIYRGPVHADYVESVSIH